MVTCRSLTPERPGVFPFLHPLPYPFPQRTHLHGHPLTIVLSLTLTFTNHIFVSHSIPSLAVTSVLKRYIDFKPLLCRRDVGAAGNGEKLHWLCGLHDKHIENKDLHVALASVSMVTSTSNSKI